MFNCSTALTYATFTVTSLFSPSLVTKLGPHTCLLLSSLPYSLFIIHLFILDTVYILITSVLVGIAAPLLWTALGTFLANNSDLRTVNRNAGVFWAIHQSSIFLGNYFAYFVIRNNEYIDSTSRRNLGYGFISVALSSTIIMMFLRKTSWVPVRNRSMRDSFRNTMRLLTSQHMGLLSLTMFYTGLHQMIWNSLHTTCVGFTVDFGEHRKALAVAGGMFFGLGEVVGKRDFKTGTSKGLVSCSSNNLL